jgi:hypothetical protein
MRKGTSFISHVGDMIDLIMFAKRPATAIVKVMALMMPPAKNLVEVPFENIRPLRCF